MDPSHPGQDCFGVAGQFPRVKKHLLHCKVFLNIDVNKLRMNISIKHSHQSTKDDIVYSIGLNVKVTETDSEAGDYLELARDWVYQGLIHHEKARRMRLHQEVKRELGQKKQEETESEDSKEVLYYWCLYDMYEYDMYGLFDFEIVLNSLDAGRDMQI